MMRWEQEGDEPPKRRSEDTKRVYRALKIASFITSTPRYWTRLKLAGKFDVTERTIDRDLLVLRALGYEIVRTGEGYEFARMPAMPPVNLSLAEVLALTLAATLARDAGDIDTASLGSALAQLEALVSVPARPLVRQELLHSGQTGPREQRRAALQTMQLAWLERRRVRIVYATASRDGELSERVIEPYSVHPYERSWIVTAFDHFRERVIDFKVDRIQAATLLDESYDIPGQFSLATYRGATWGILRGQATEPVEIVLLFDEESGRWVREEQRDERMAFETQQDGQVLARLTAGITPEFIRWILWYGPHCQVLQPDDLRNSVAELAARVVALVRPVQAADAEPIFGCS